MQLTSPDVELKVKLWSDLQNEIVGCRKCPRLVKFREKVARERKREFHDFEYWGRPVPSFGSPNARLIIIGLAPAAHGGNRTGRMFTGDGSSKFLFKHLHASGFAIQPSSERRDDGQKLIDCYITATLHCVPPDNRPTRMEIERCSEYLARELPMLDNSKAILALGKIAFDSIIDFARDCYSAEGKFVFSHGERFKVAENFPLVYASYHPSPRNTQTGKMTGKMFLKVLIMIKKDLN
ncbi:MAG: uracil-DNA glycosylase [Nitrososphaerales archaeon]